MPRLPSAAARRGNAFMRMACVLLLATVATLTPAYAAPTTLTFSNDTGLGDGTASDGDGGSASIPGITINVVNILDVAGTSAGVIHWRDPGFMFSADASYSGLTYDDGANTPMRGMAIRSAGGEEFKLTTFRYYNWGETISTTISVVGYRDGAQVASMTFEGYNPSAEPSTISLAAFPDFGNVDDVRLFQSAGGTTGDAGSFHSLNNIVIDDAVVPDTTPPTITSINSSTANGTYKIGDVIAVQINFSENVVVTGTPRLTLETGATDRAVNYTSGSGTSTLSFNYTVQAGDATADLDYVATSALALNGGTIRDAAGNSAILTLASPGAANSLGANKNLVIDGIVPTVSSVNASTANGTYKVGDVISLQIAFSETVTVTGTPQLTLETGATDRAVNYTSGSGTSTLSFNYTVQAGDSSADLDYAGTSSLTLNGGTLRDAAGNNATLTLATPGTANSLGANKALVIDGVMPSVASITVTGSPASSATTVSFTVVFSESVSNVSTDDFALATTGSASGSVTSVSGSGTTFNVTVNAISGVGTLKLNLNASTNITDAAGNAGPAAYTSGSTHSVAIPTAPGAPTIGTATAGDGQVSVTFTAPASNGGAAITTYIATASPGGAFGTCAGPAACTATVTGLNNGTAYSFTVTATNAIGTSPASSASNLATPKGQQTITFANPGAQNFGTAPTLTAIATSALPVTFSSVTTGVCTITSDGTLGFVTAGTCTIDADQAGDTTFNAATTITQTFTVNAVTPAAPTIGTATAGDTEATITFTAPASSGGNAISGYTVTASPGGATATGSSSPITVTGLTNGVAYTFTVTADNAAGTGAASAASNAITPASPQTITFGNPGTQNFGTTPTLTASSSAGGSYPIGFTSSTTGVCTTTAGGALTFVSAGSCTINANQAGDTSYLAAQQVSQTFTVAAVSPGAPTAVTATAGDTQASISFTAPTSTGGAPITSYTVTSSPDGLTADGSGSPIVVTGLTNGIAYTFTVTATNVAGTGSMSSSSNPIYTAASQTITFAAPGAQNFGTTPTFTATSDSGLTPVFTSSTTAVCTITSSGVLSFVAAGACTIHADQPGNGSYLPAQQVTHTFAVNAVLPGAPSNPVATLDTPGAVSVSFDAPTSSGGTAITSYTVTSLPGGLTGTGAASPIVVSGLSPGTSYTFTVRAINPVGGGASSIASNALTPAPALVASAVSANVPYAAAATAITLDIIGTPTSVAVASTPAHGTAIATGTTITYQPAPGYAGADSFSYTATDAYTTSAAATVSITVQAPAITLDNASLADAVGGSVYQQQLIASGGTAPYTMQLISGTLPAGLTLASDGELSGTPTAAGSFNLTLRATDSSTGTGPFSVDRAYTLTVAAPQIELQQDSVRPASHGTAYDQTLQASGGTAPYTFTLVSGALPAGMSLSTDGKLSGQPTQAGSYAFTLQVSDANGFSANQATTLVVERAAQVIAEFVTLPATPVYVPNGSFEVSASGGTSTMPLVFAATTPAVCQVTGARVTMLAAGLCRLTADQAGDDNYSAAAQAVLEVTIAAATPVLQWPEELQKIFGEAAFDLPEPQSNSEGSFSYSSDNPRVATVNGRTVTLVGAGTATLVATQAAAGGFADASVQMRLVVTDRPDPTLDAEVVAGLQAQVDASIRFAAAQQGNIRDRLRQIRNGNNASSNALSLNYAGDERIPGMALPVGQAVGSRWPAVRNGWGIWMAGTVNFGKSGGGRKYDFQSDGVTVGADRALGEHALIGIAGSVARQDSDASGSPSSVKADQRSLAVYGLWGAGRHVFVDGMLAYGQLDFDLVRWSDPAGRAAAAQRDGDQVFGSLTLGYEHRNDKGLSLTGYGRLDGSRTTLDAYRERGLGLYDLVYRNQEVQNTALAIGVEGSFVFGELSARYRPFWNVEYAQALENQGMARINYVQQSALNDYGLRLRSYYDDRLSISAGMDIKLDAGWLFSFKLGHEQGRNATRANSIGLSISYGSGGSAAGAARTTLADPENGLADEERQCRGGQCRRTR
ncbi:fibronectin type III domain-containing protein [Luteimonas sp. RIT-PG2_3]